MDKRGSIDILWTRDQFCDFVLMSFMDDPLLVFAKLKYLFSFHFISICTLFYVRFNYSKSFS